jgi:hypothetical protein
MKKLFLSFIFLLAAVSLNVRPCTGLSHSEFIQEGVINGIAYLTGGVGIEERRAMEEMAEHRIYTLKVVVAAVSGSYLSDLMVHIEKSDGEMIFTGLTNGPWLYVNLPKGAYKVTVSHDFQAKKKVVQVGDEMKTLLFHWKV